MREGDKKPLNTENGAKAIVIETTKGQVVVVGPYQWEVLY
jgi:hypothetical protein